MCPHMSNKEWATIMIKYRPLWFDQRAVTPDTGLVVADHDVATNDERGRKDWLAFVQNEVFGKRNRDYLT